MTLNIRRLVVIYHLRVIHSLFPSRSCSLVVEAFKAFFNGEILTFLYISKIHPYTSVHNSRYTFNVNYGGG